MRAERSPRSFRDLSDEREPCLLGAGFYPHPKTRFFLSAERPEGEARRPLFKYNFLNQSHY